MIRKIIFFFILCLRFQISLSQVIQDSTFQQEDSISKIILTQSYRSFFSDSLMLYIPQNDYLLLSDPNPYYISLNNYKSLVLEKNKFTDKISNFQNGLTGFDPYYITKEKFKFINSNKPYTEVEAYEAKSYTNSQSELQNQLDVKAFFAQTYSNNIIWNFRYDKTNQKGMYNNNKNRYHNFSTGLQIAPPKSKLSADLILTYNNLSNQHNFGILDSTNLEQSNYRVREAIPVYNLNANSKIKNAEYGANLKYLITNSNTIKTKLSYYTGYSFFKYNFEDLEVRSVIPKYGHYLIDSNHINLIYNQYNWNNRINLDISINRYLTAQVSQNYNSISYHYDTLTTKLIQKNFNTSISSNLIPRTIITLGLLSDINYKNQSEIYGQINYDNHSLYDINLLLKNSNVAPTLLESKLILNKKFNFSNNFKNQNSQLLELNFIANKKYLPEVKIQFEKISNLIYFNDDLKFTQSSSVINHFSSLINYQLKVGIFGSQHRFGLDFYNPDIPNWNLMHGAHNIFTNLNVFKNAAKIKLGVEAEWINIDKTYNFFPLLNQFSNSNISSGNIHPNIKFFTVFRVAEFQVDLHFDHIESFFTKNSFIIENYPIYDFYFWFKINWKFNY
jgi:hypothetical protein